MDKIIEIANELVSEFINCESYKKYIYIKLKINNDPDLKDKLAEFEKASDIYETKRMQDDYISFDEERIISNMYTELWLSDDARAYLEAQRKLYETLRQVLEIIEKNCLL